MVRGRRQRSGSSSAVGRIVSAKPFGKVFGKRSATRVVGQFEIGSPAHERRDVTQSRHA